MSKEKTYSEVVDEINAEPSITFSKNFILRKRWIVWALDFSTLNRILKRKALKCKTYTIGEKNITSIKKTDLLDYVEQHHRLYE